MGNRPKPTALKRKQGNPGKQKLNDREPQPEIALPSCPDYLPEGARALWDRVGSELVANGIMTALDGPALADLIEVEVLNQVLTREMQQAPEPVLSAGDAVSTKKNPLWMLKLEYLRERRAQHAEFGMTPASRSKIVAVVTVDEDPMESALREAAGGTLSRNGKPLH